MTKRNKALAMTIRRALLLIADAIKVWCDGGDDAEPVVVSHGRNAVKG